MELGRRSAELVAGQPSWWWIKLWRHCHELRWASSGLAYWSKLEWPETNGLMEQDNIIVEMFIIIGDIKASILVDDLKRAHKMRGKNG